MPSTDKSGRVRSRLGAGLIAAWTALFPGPVPGSGAQVKSAADLTALFDTISRQKIKTAFIPEYEKTLSTVILSLNSNASSAQLEIIRSLPDYSNIIVFIKKDENLGVLKGRLTGLLPESRVEGITFIRTDKREKSVADSSDDNHALLLDWMQDIGKGGREAFFIPLTHFSPVVTHFDNLYVESLGEVGVKVVRLPVFFEGGNLLLARNGSGRRYLIVGKKSLDVSRELYAQLQVRHSDRFLLGFLKKVFSADEVLILDERFSPRSDFILHLDQVLMPLADGKIAVQTLDALPPAPASSSQRMKKAMDRELERSRMSGAPAQAQAALERDLRRKLIQARLYEEALAYRQKLEKDRDLLERHGFELVNLSTDIYRLIQYQSYANAIVFTHKSRGRKSIIFPVYPDQQGHYDRDHYHALNKARLEALGFEVIPVLERAFPLGGNSHCLVNVLDQPRP